MKFSNPYLSNIEKANYLQKWLLVHSMLYYDLDNPIISDTMFDANGKQLVELMERMTEEEKKKTRFYNAFYDYVGSTGFYLCSRLDAEETRYISMNANIALGAFRRSSESF